MSEIKDFENMKDNAKLKAFQKVNLERPLTTNEFEEFKELANKKLRREI